MSVHKTTAKPPARRFALPPAARRLLDQQYLGQKGLTWLLWLFCAGLALFVICALALLGGYGSARSTHNRWLALAGAGDLQSQFELGLDEIESGAYDLARQRFEYILQNDPGFPGAQERLVEVLAILSATATPTPLPATATPTPTRDSRPAEELFNNARLKFAAGDWDAAVEALLGLRSAGPEHRVAEVDGMLYLALRSRGVDKILNRRNLEGGAFDLALAERFGPLDAAANQARELARLYTLGLSFWEVYPEQAVFYFGQVAAASPYLTDASGWTAQARYAAVLAQWGDQLLAVGDPCAAQEKYELALQAGAGGEAQASLQRAVEACSPPTATEGPSGTPTETPTGFATASVTPSPTTGASPIPGATATATWTTTTGPAPSTPTATTTAAPSETPAETAPAPSDTPAPTDGPPPATEAPTQAPTAGEPEPSPTTEETRVPALPDQGGTLAP